VRRNQIALRPKPLDSRGPIELKVFLSKGYFLQQPLLQLFSSVTIVATVALSAQHPAPQDFAPSAQQSHLQSSHEQTPVSQQHPPSGQQVSQEQTFESAVEFEVPKEFAPIATPSPMTHNNINVAINFILNSFTCFLKTAF
jgi:hypothetical protein